MRGDAAAPSVGVAGLGAAPAAAWRARMGKRTGIGVGTRMGTMLMVMGMHMGMSMVMGVHAHWQVQGHGHCLVRAVEHIVLARAVHLVVRAHRAQPRFAVERQLQWHLPDLARSGTCRST